MSMAWAVPVPASSASRRMVHGFTAMPSRAVGIANVASGAATRRSQASASCAPAPMAGPLTAAITGTVTSVTAASIAYSESRNAAS